MLPALVERSALFCFGTEEAERDLEVFALLVKLVVEQNPDRLWYSLHLRFLVRYGVREREREDREMNAGGGSTLAGTSPRFARSGKGS